MNIKVQILPKATKQLSVKLRSSQLIKQFYLSGGTGLALQLGHRESEDLDFFGEENFNPILLQKELEKIDRLVGVEISEGTFNVFLSGVKLQFLYYPYKLIKPPIDWDGIKISSILDIACTKLITISSRGSKKDFIDLYFILQAFTLEDLFKSLDEKYSGTNYNHAHILKSLVYFDDAEKQPMPRMHIQVMWEDVKKTIIGEVKILKF